MAGSKDNVLEFDHTRNVERIEPRSTRDFSLPDELPDSQPPEQAHIERIGRYQLRFELASGGMATVYLARTAGPGGFEKLAALKRIHPHLAKEREYVEMFLDEARIAARISHANVCSVFDFGEADGNYFIAMEYLLGETLNRVLKAAVRAGKCSDPVVWSAYVARIVGDACEGLHAAHELRKPNGEFLNVVHRDVSPQNLFVTYDGVTKVVDFGIATASDRLHKTVTGHIKGKYAYMSPEQLSSGTLDRRSDVWALGVILWEMLTQRRLFRRDTQFETMHAVLDDPIPLPSEMNPGLPTFLDPIVMKALDRDRSMRYPTARHLGSDLQNGVARYASPIGLAELAALMEEVFPGKHAAKRQLLEIARIDDPVPAIHDGDTAASLSMLQPDLDRGARTHRAPPKWRGGVGVILLCFAAVAVGLMLSQSSLLGGYPTAQQVPPVPVARPPAAAPSEVEVAVEANAEPTDEFPSSEPSAAELDEPVPAPREPVAKAAKVNRPNRPNRPNRLRRGGGGGGHVSATAVSPGVASVITPNGWAHVHTSSGQFLGSTPLRVELPPGVHTLVFQPFGEPRTVRKRVTIVSGEITRVIQPLIPE